MKYKAIFAAVTLMTTTTLVNANSASSVKNDGKANGNAYGHNVCNVKSNGKSGCTDKNKNNGNSGNNGNSENNGNGGSSGNANGNSGNGNTGNNNNNGNNGNNGNDGNNGNNGNNGNDGNTGNSNNSGTGDNTNGNTGNTGSPVNNGGSTNGSITGSVSGTNSNSNKNDVNGTNKSNNKVNSSNVNNNALNGTNTSTNKNDVNSTATTGNNQNSVSGQSDSNSDASAINGDNVNTATTGSNKSSTYVEANDNSVSIETSLSYVLPNMTETPATTLSNPTMQTQVTSCSALVDIKRNSVTGVYQGLIFKTKLDQGHDDTVQSFKDENGNEQLFKVMNVAGKQILVGNQLYITSSVISLGGSRQIGLGGGGVSSNYGQGTFGNTSQTQRLVTNIVAVPCVVGEIGTSLAKNIKE